MKAGAREERSVVCRNAAPMARSDCRAGQSPLCLHICCKTVASGELGSPHSATLGSLHPLPARWGSQRALWVGQGQDKPQVSPFFLLAEQFVSELQRSTSLGAAPNQPRW